MTSVDRRSVGAAGGGGTGAATGAAAAGAGAGAGVGEDAHATRRRGRRFRMGPRFTTRLEPRPMGTRVARGTDVVDTLVIWRRSGCGDALGCMVRPPCCMNRPFHG